MAELSQTLRRLADLLRQDDDPPEEARRALDRLQRDLLPRTVSGTTYVVAGIVGPNNSGKSALFNALAGADLSPSLPTGGATRRLVGAAGPELARRLAADASLERFAVRPAGPGDERAAATISPADPRELVLHAVDLPDGVLLIDTPDFDSILEENRFASESLLAVSDLAVAVVTRHTYQNREVVRFLERWLAHGRPWLLVYNEAPSPELAREHAAKLARDLGHEPLAVFAALHSLAVQEGAEPLLPRAVSGAAGPAAGTPLRDFLLDVERISEVKERALAASLAQLGDDLAGWCARLREEARDASLLLEAAEARARAAAERIGACAMPGGPFIEAFRNVLDRRSNPFSRRWRDALRKLRLRLESIPPTLLGARRPAAPDAARQGLVDVERAELERAWPALWDGLVRELGRGGDSAAKGRAPARVALAVDEALDEGRGPAARAAAVRALAEGAIDLDAFRAVCEGLVEEALRERGRDWDIQAAADVATIAPLAIATAVILKTGGLGSDIGVAGGAALSSYLFEKYSHLLGTRITREASRRWAEQRAREVEPLLTSAALGPAAELLRATRARYLALADEVEGLAAALTP